MTGAPSRDDDARTNPSPRVVLYVDDDVQNLLLVRRILSRRPDVALLTADDGHRGLEAALEHRPCLVLLDRNLPTMSGDDVLVRLRADPRTAAIPVVVISGSTDPAHIAQTRAAGANGYLTKPYTIDELLAAIDTFATR